VTATIAVALIMVVAVAMVSTVSGAEVGSDTFSCENCGHVVAEIEEVATKWWWYCFKVEAKAVVMVTAVLEVTAREATF